MTRVMGGRGQTGHDEGRGEQGAGEGRGGQGADGPRRESWGAVGRRAMARVVGARGQAFSCAQGPACFSLGLVGRLCHEAVWGRGCDETPHLELSRPCDLRKFLSRFLDRKATSSSLVLGSGWGTGSVCKGTGSGSGCTPHPGTHCLHPLPLPASRRAIPATCPGPG